MGKAKRKSQHIAKMAAKKAKKKSPAYLKAEQSANRTTSVKKKNAGPQNSYSTKKKGANKGLYRGGPLYDTPRIDANGIEYIAKAQITNEQKMLEVAARIEARKYKTPYEQYELLNYRLGDDIGAVKERARLLKMTEKD
jgi:hypothetical protein